MAKALRKTASRHATAARVSAAYKARSRARIATLASEGRGAQALREVSTLLGIDVTQRRPLRLTRVRGVPIA
jgi:hypothetical protein